MKFLMLNADHYVNHEAVSELTVTGREGDVRTEAVLKNGERVILHRYKDFGPARQDLRDLVERMESE